jgi:DNA-binding response OmpR family regulator
MEPSGQRILIVDDEPNVRLMLRTALESSGYRVLEAVDGLDALAQLERSPCDLVLLDLRMPKLDGMGTLARLRERGHATPVVMLTAHGSIPDAVAAMRLGAIDFLTKPITPGELRAVVGDVIERNRDRAPASPGLGGSLAARPPSFGFELARAKRAINRGEFEEAERLLREVLAGDPHSKEAHELLDQLFTLKEREGSGAFPLLREWFPAGAGKVKR